MKNLIKLSVSILLLSIFLVGCTISEKPVELTIGVMSDEGAIPFVIAQTEKIYEKNGLKVQVEVFKSATDRDAAFAAGKLDAMMSDMLATAMLRESGTEIDILFTTDGDYLLVASPAESSADATTPKTTLKVGISSNTVIEFITDKITQEKLTDIEVIKEAIPQMPVRLELLGAGKIDAATLPQPLAAIAGGEVIMKASDLGYFPGIFIAKTETVSQKKDIFEKFIKSYEQAISFADEKIKADKLDEILASTKETLGFPEHISSENYQIDGFTMIHSYDQKTYDAVIEWLGNK